MTGFTSSDPPDRISDRGSHQRPEPTSRSLPLRSNHDKIQVGYEIGVGGMGRVWLFFTSMFSKWGSGLSGPASIPLAVMALYTSGHVLRIAYASLAVILGIYSTYSVWGREYDRAERELARHTRPQIVPEVLACFWDVLRPEGTDTLQTYVYAFVRLTNLTDVQTLVRRYELETQNEGRTLAGVSDSAFLGGVIRHRSSLSLPGSRRGEGAIFTDISTISYSVNQQTPLRRGIHVTGGIAVPIDLHHVNAYDSFQATVSLRVTDSFGDVHSSEPANQVVYYGEFTPAQRES